jgi:protein TonB
MHAGTGLAGAAQSGLEARRSRLLVQAVVCSLVLHVLVFAWLAAVRDHNPVRAPAPPLTAHLAKPKPPPRAEPPPAPVARAAPPRPAPQPAPLPLLAPAQPAAAAAPTVPATPPAPAVPAVVAVPTLAPPAPPALPRAESAPGTPPAAPVASGPDPGTVARFRLELMDVARRYKRYPRVAQDNNWEGRVELRIAYAESGAVASMTVRKGTGRAVLDEEAQAMLRSAQAQVVVPPALRGKAFTLDIPVDFYLRDDAR